jgi:uncharacterized membrane protein YedE/YeeE
VIFGVGWAMQGVCPGPAVAALATGRIEPLLFVASMLAGMALYAPLDRSLRARGGVGITDAPSP